MKFYESGLPDNETIEAAFNYSHANAISYQAEAMKSFTQQITASYQQHISMLEMDKASGDLSEKDYLRQVDDMKRMRDQQMKMGPKLVEDELNNMFCQRRLAPALEIMKNSENASPELMAAILLIECVRSPIDYQKVEKNFGKGIAGLLAEVHHLDAYPSERDANLLAAGSDTKRAYLALLVTSMEQIVEQIRQMTQMNPGQSVVVPPGQEESLFENAKILRGNDKKLDQRFFDSFNRMAQATSSAFRLEVGADGALELVKGNQNPPHNPGFPTVTPPKKSGLGDDVF